MIEDIFGIDKINFCDKIWKDVVKDVCFFASELKLQFERKINDMIIEIAKIREEMNFYKEEKNELEQKLISEETNFRTKLEEKMINYEEKVDLFIFFI